MEAAIAAAKEEGILKFIYDETYAANLALQECLRAAGDSVAHRDACKADFESTLRRMVKAVEDTREVPTTPAPR